MCWQHLAPLSCPSPQKSQFKPRRPSPPEQNLQEDTYLRRVLGRDLTLGQPVAHGDGDKPLAKRGRRVRAFLESLRTVQGHVKGEQGLPGQALPVWDRGLSTVPAAPSPCCLVPVCVPSLLRQLALPPSLHIPRTGGGTGPSWHLCPPCRIPDPSCSTGWRLQVLAGGQSWLVAPSAGTRLGCHTLGQDRATSPPPACTSGSLHCVRMGCFGCLVPLGVTNQPKTPQSPPFSSGSCCGSGRILAAPLGTKRPDGPVPMAVLPKGV